MFVLAYFNDSDLERMMTIVVLIFVSFGVVGAFYSLGFEYLYKPFLRREQIRLFLDLLERSLKSGLNIEQSLLLMAESKEKSLGVEFYLAVAKIESGLSFKETLRQQTNFLPNKICSIIQVGIETENLLGVLPVARQTLFPVQSEVRGNENFLLAIAFSGGPAATVLLFLLSIFIFPRFKMIFADLNEGLVVMPAFSDFTLNNPQFYVGIIIAITLLTWLIAWLHSGEPAGLRWLQAGIFPFNSWLELKLPWKRKRMLRDFSAMLALLLDSGLPEENALRLAGDCTANWYFREKAEQAIRKLQAGQKLTEAVAELDDSMDFRWRLENAKHSPFGFRKALDGWLESLAAKAYQQEQTSAQVIASVLVVLNGVLIGSIVVAVFMMLTSLIEASTLW